MRTRTLALAALLLPLPGCDTEPIGPEPCPEPCVRTVGYLSLDSIYLTGATGAAYDGLPLVPATGARVAYTVTNVGDTLSEPAPVFINYLAESAIRDTVPPLAPGATVTREIPLDYGGVPPFRHGDGDRDRVSVLIDAPADSIRSYSWATSPQYRAAIPLLALQVTADSLRVRAGQPLAGDFRIVNRSRHAASPPLRVVGCLFDRFWGCWPEYWTAFGGWNLPAIDPLATHTFATSVTVPVTAAWQDEDLAYVLGVCSVPTGHSDPYVSPNAVNCGGGGVELLVRPDYLACAPPLLQPGTPAGLTAYNCGLRPGTTLTYEGLSPTATEQRRFHLFALDVTAGTTYRVLRSTGTQPLRFYDADGFTQEDLDPAADRVRFSEGGRRYLVLYSPQPAVTVTLEVL